MLRWKPAASRTVRGKTHCYTKKLANLAASILFYLLKKS
jgi:hypothetical protein